MITKEILDSFQKGEKVTYIYISKITNLPCFLKGFIEGDTMEIENIHKRFLLVKDNRGKYIEEGEGYLLKGWHDIIDCPNELTLNINLLTLIKYKRLEKYIVG